MGATNPANAAEGTIRKRFAASIERNCVHGSDAPETAAVEIPFFFSYFRAAVAAISCPAAPPGRTPLPRVLPRVLPVAQSKACVPCC